MAVAGDTINVLMDIGEAAAYFDGYVYEGETLAVSRLMDGTWVAKFTNHYGDTYTGKGDTCGEALQNMETSVEDEEPDISETEA